MNNVLSDAAEDSIVGSMFGGLFLAMFAVIIDSRLLVLVGLGVSLLMMGIILAVGVYEDFIR